MSLEQTRTEVTLGLSISLCDNLYMIEVERVNGLKVFINPDLVRTIEKAPDVIITFTDGEKLLLKTPPEEIIEKIILFKRRALPEIIG